MLSALLKRLEPEPLVRNNRQDAEILADVHRDLERDVDFVVRPGRGGWMIARLRKSGIFHSWVEG